LIFLFPKVNKQQKYFKAFSRGYILVISHVFFPVFSDNYYKKNHIFQPRPRMGAVMQTTVSKG